MKQHKAVVLQLLPLAPWAFSNLHLANDQMHLAASSEVDESVTNLRGRDIEYGAEGRNLFNLGSLIDPKDVLLKEDEQGKRRDHDQNEPYNDQGELAECVAMMKDQLKPLPCLEQIKEATVNDHYLNEITKSLLLLSLDKLTYERRNAWLTTLNPVVVKKPQLLNIRNVCAAGSIALVLIGNGISNNVQEWLLYHLLIGVRTIIIFDDSLPESVEQESLHRAIAPFLELDYIVQHDASGFSGAPTHKQEQVYNFALQMYGKEYDWIGFIDSDEFIVLHQEICLTSFLSNYNDFGGVVLQWRWFSPLGVPIHDTKKTYFEQYLYWVEDQKRHIKSIVQPKYVEKMLIHHAIYKENWAVNAQKDRVEGPFNVDIEPAKAFEVAELRHFYMGDIMFALFEKICGLNGERELYRDVRIHQLKHCFYEGSTQKITSLPIIHNVLTELLFNNAG